MNRSKWFTMAAVLALSTSLAIAAPHGKGGKRGHGKRGGELGARFAEKLNLSEAQKQQMQDIRREFREANAGFFAQMRETRKQMKEARQAGDTARAESLKATAQAQREQMKQLRDAQQQRVEALLTPDQRAQLETMKAEREARRGEHGRRHGRHGKMRSE